jgi:hypothetical protein
LGRALLLFGIVLSTVGLLVLWSPKVPWIGRLPGDIAIRRDGFSFYFPLTSCLLASVVVSVVLWLISRFRQ